MSNNKYQINQTINGNGHQIAAHDVVNINKGDGFQPNPNNPNLITCPACERYGIYREADMCQCGYSFEKARLQQQREANDKLIFWSKGVIGVLVLVFYVTQKLETGFFETLITIFIISGLTWFAGIRLWANTVVWLEERKQKHNHDPSN